MDKNFDLNCNLIIQSDISYTGVKLGVKRMYRDMERTLNKTDVQGNIIKLKKEENLPAEVFHIYFYGEDTMIIGASGELGFIYGLLYLSEIYLGILPFWFWNDQEFIRKDRVKIPYGEYLSPVPKIAYRGWFINDEVLLDKWDAGENIMFPWEMAMETLLRCRGNLIIPGTDNNSRKYRKLASNMGLWITHHHAEPLGAEMFSRKYPKLNPSYAQYPDLFFKLWEEGIEEQKETKVIWNLGFRGQGDCPFWEGDPRYSTAETRGGLISSVIKKQYDLVREKVNDPVCCTNLYGEIMELYRDGYLKLPEDIIKIWADNGYGKMVSRRQGNSNPRIYALPREEEINRTDSSTGQNRQLKMKGHHGLYYHVSFYDLQAANHLTMQPNSLEFVAKELETAFSKGVEDFLIVNCSNIKPHVYFLDGIKKMWSEGNMDSLSQGREYVNNYFFGGFGTEEAITRVQECFSEYADCTVPFGTEEDEHGGEQLYNYTVRIFTSNWLKGEYRDTVRDLEWAFGKASFKEQLEQFYLLCQKSREKFGALYEKCLQVQKSLPRGNAGTLFGDSILLQVNLHLYCLNGAVAFYNSFQLFLKNDYQAAFLKAGEARDEFVKADEAMRLTEHGKWEGFYANDCLCDIKQTAYQLGFIMGYVRNIGDGPHFYNWQREFLYPEEERKVVLLTNKENHLTNEELFKIMKKKYIG